jgi:hypothetical protein
VRGGDSPAEGVKSGEVAYFVRRRLEAAVCFVRRRLERQRRTLCPRLGIKGVTWRGKAAAGKGRRLENDGRSDQDFRNAFFSRWVRDYGWGERMDVDRLIETLYGPDLIFQPSFCLYK